MRLSRNRWWELSSKNGIAIHITIKKSSVTTVAAVRGFFDFRP
jgi:hypothetical protein